MRCKAICDGFAGCHHESARQKVRRSIRSVWCVSVFLMADATKQSPNGIKAPKIRDSVQVAKERLGKSQSRSLSCYLALYNSCQFLCWYAIFPASFVVHVSSRMCYCWQVLHPFGVVVCSPPPSVGQRRKQPESRANRRFNHGNPSRFAQMGAIVSGD